jgi:hypothetical protein
MMVWTVSSTETLHCHLYSYSQNCYRRDVYSFSTLEEDIKHSISLLASIDNFKHPLPLCTSIFNNIYLETILSSDDVLTLYIYSNLLVVASIYQSVRLITRIKQFRTIARQRIRSRSISHTGLRDI